MRNQIVRFKTPLIFLTVLLPGCVAHPGVTRKLDDGFSQLKDKNFNQAVTSADEILNTKPRPPVATLAQAHYLKGRAFEEREKPNESQGASDLQRAREEYIRGLELNPPQPVLANLRSQVANVAYFQEDYATALSQWGMSLAHLTDDRSRAWALYRMGLCQQRQGQWTTADDTFASVQKSYPGSIPADRAKARAGARAFFVQIGVFNNPAGADRAMTDARKQGVVPTKTVDPKGAQIIRVGPYPAYPTAKATRARLLIAFPDAAIVP